MKNNISKIKFKKMNLRLILKSFGYGVISILMIGFSQAQAQKVYNAPLYSFKDLPTRSVYQNAKLPAEQRARDVLNHLTFEETLSLVGGWNKFYFPGISRLGLRPVFMADASQGIRLGTGFSETDFSTSFPGMLALAST